MTPFGGYDEEIWICRSQDAIATLSNFVSDRYSIISHEDPRDFTFLLGLIGLPQEHKYNKSEVATWYLDHLTTQLPGPCWVTSQRHFDLLLGAILQTPFADSALVKACFRLPWNINIIQDKTQNYLARCASYLSNPDFPTEIPRTLIEAGLRLDSIGEDWIYPDMMRIPSKKHTALLRAMSTSLSFHRWRCLLQECQIPLVNLAQSETVDGMPLAELGWNASSLFNLLDYSFEPFQEYEVANGCVFHDIPDAVELWWSVNVNRFRRGEPPLEAPSELRFEERCEQNRQIWAGYFWHCGSKYVNGTYELDIEAREQESRDLSLGQDTRSTFDGEEPMTQGAQVLLGFSCFVWGFQVILLDFLRFLGHFILFIISYLFFRLHHLAVDSS